MKSGRNHQGFTIVETMIVLAVTSAILISALSLIGGSQNRAQFTQSINEINAQIGSVANNVANGYYASSINDKTCRVGTSADPEPYFESAVNSLGKNNECVYLGRVIQFTKDQEYYLHNVLGRRLAAGSGKEVTTMEQAYPRIIDSRNGKTSYPNTTEDKLLQGGLTVGFMAYKEGGLYKQTSGLAFMGSLASAGTTADSIQSGAQTVDIAPLQGSLLSDDDQAFMNRFEADSSSGFAKTYDTVRNPDGGVVICFDSGTTDQLALITVGKDNRRGSTTMEIKEGKCSAEFAP